MCIQEPVLFDLGMGSATVAAAAAAKHDGGQPNQPDGRVGDGPAATAFSGRSDAHVAAVGRQQREYGNWDGESVVLTI